ncbi:hypothetical protein NV379_00210 [Paenibacillus sp. N1-5-1-14]|uniref:hypothetical protein n=1 Tax=Paenibacillus radicibacter TaxID=2972488 RepID=UPI002159B25F|nr:hypothetical protein [Paenibacillus radicibacter]MCR8641064.1 hypothetical protein [Paenibacillus radicibacter]
MNDSKLYNLIFPVWFLIFFPPVILLTIVGNFIVDSLVILAAFYAFGLRQHGLGLEPYYWKNILKVWGFGFLADVIGAVFLLAVLIGSEMWVPSLEIGAAISWNTYAHWFGLPIILLAMLISSILIYWFNYRFTFRLTLPDSGLRKNICLTLAIVTSPWTFLIPTSWLYHF